MDHLDLLIFPFGPVILSVALAIPAALHQRSWARFFISPFLVAFEIGLPLFVFLMSAALVPEWKGGCQLGWIDCFHQGKLALVPLALWASAAWYAVDIYRVTGRTRQHPWIVLGMLQGAVVSSVCLGYGIVFVGVQKAGSAGIWLFLVVPLVVALGYSFRSAQLIRAATLTPIAYWMSLLLTTPFWFGSLIWSARIYAALPDKKPDACFVVTAASRGHPAFVGPFLETNHRGECRRANRQLVTFWQFEDLWRQRSPASHAAFRRVYGRVGPVIARHISRRWMADLVHLALKPAEWVARWLVRR